jgi:hypothetical protein
MVEQLMVILPGEKLSAPPRSFGPASPAQRRIDAISNLGPGVDG